MAENIMTEEERILPCNALSLMAADLDAINYIPIGHSVQEELFSPKDALNSHRQHLECIKDNSKAIA